MSQNENIHNFHWEQVPEHLKADVAIAQRAVSDWAIEQVVDAQPEDHDIEDENDMGYWPTIDCEYVTLTADEEQTFRVKVHGESNDLRSACHTLLRLVRDAEVGGRVPKGWGGGAPAVIAAWLDTEDEG